MSEFAGRWKLKDSENFEEFMTVMGAPWMVRKMVCAAKPKLEVTVDGDHYHFKESFPMRSIHLEFDLDREFEDKAMDGKRYRTTVTKEGNKLVEHERYDEFEVVRTREVRGDELRVTIEAKGVTAVRVFRRED